MLAHGPLSGLLQLRVALQCRARHDRGEPGGVHFGKKVAVGSQW